MGAAPLITRGCDEYETKRLQLAVAQAGFHFGSRAAATAKERRVSLRPSGGSVCRWVFKLQSCLLGENDPTATKERACTHTICSSSSRRRRHTSCLSHQRPSGLRWMCIRVFSVLWPLCAEKSLKSQKRHGRCLYYSKLWWYITKGVVVDGAATRPKNIGKPEQELQQPTTCRERVPKTRIIPNFHPCRRAKDVSGRVQVRRALFFSPLEVPHAARTICDSSRQTTARPPQPDELCGVIHDLVLTWVSVYTTSCLRG